MASGQPIDIDALDDDTLQVAREAAAAAGMSLEDWLARTLGDTSAGEPPAGSKPDTAADDQWTIGSPSPGLDETVVVSSLAGHPTGTGSPPPRATPAAGMAAALATLAASVAPTIRDPRWTRRIASIRAAIPAPPPSPPPPPTAAQPAAAEPGPPPVRPAAARPAEAAPPSDASQREPRLETPAPARPAPVVGPGVPAPEAPAEATPMPAPAAAAGSGGELEKAIAAARERRRIADETGQRPRRRAGGGFLVNLLIALLAIVSIAVIGGLVYAWVNPDTTVDELASDVSREAGALYDVAATQVENWLGLDDEGAADDTDGTIAGGDGTDMATADDPDASGDAVVDGGDGTGMTDGQPADATMAGDDVAGADPAVEPGDADAAGTASTGTPTDDGATTGDAAEDDGSAPAVSGGEAAGNAAGVADGPASDTGDDAGAGAAPPGEPAAITELRNRAEAGDPEAQRALGERYLEGDGVARDDATAVRWLEQAVERGDPEAMYMLGRLHESGTGVPQDDLVAIALYVNASEQGMPRAAMRLGEIYRDGDLNWPQSYGEAATQFRIAADAGVGPAEHELAELYANGLGVDESPLLAHLWFTRAAAHGSPGAAARAEEMAALLTPEQLAQSAAMTDAPPETGTTLYGVDALSEPGSGAEPPASTATTGPAETAETDAGGADSATPPSFAEPGADDAGGTAAERGDDTGTEAGTGTAADAGDDAVTGGPVEAVEPPREVATIPVTPPAPVGDTGGAAGTGIGTAPDAGLEGTEEDADVAAPGALTPQAIAEIQGLLNQLEYDAGPADGIPGRRTTAAIRAYQLAEGLLPADGLPSLSLLVRLRDSTRAQGQADSQ